ncbi:MAG: type II 3-dehydroquinate dehydratase [Saprospiraceae bacterium]|nr:type II 3-dehydroquinate dehydratase [Bacteroidia bacterium]NNE13588.1 type II 3-dehydroquinate dehydratase [Saprospiraceae bacterium]NNL92929.1 type II 3-dehydroquinate dehydratase [Saprospiraceae bacterium]
MKILILNGPNLNLLGTRQTDIYGEQTMEEIFGDIKEHFADHQISYLQSNHEGDIIDKLHEVGFDFDGVVLNAGAYTHTSIAIADAINAITTPVVELHISDIYKREAFRKVSFLKDVCVHHIIGKGVAGYKLAVAYLINTDQN